MADPRIESFRKRVIEQADALGDAGWMDIDVPKAFRASGTLRVPRPPFELWCVSRSNGSHLVSPWTIVCPVGIKQGADDPYHTDWMLGAGLDPLDMRHSGGNPHHEAFSKAAWKARHGVEERLLGLKASVLLQGPWVKGRIHLPVSFDDVPTERDEDGLPPVSIVKNAGPDWLAVAVATLRLGGAVIVERGGEMAHLVTELRASSQGPIMRVEKARTLYKDGGVLTVDPSKGEVKLAEDERLVAEAVATARAAPDWVAEPPEEPIPEMTKAAPVAMPSKSVAGGSDFGIREAVRGKQDLSDRYRNEEPMGKYEFQFHLVYATMHFDRGAYYDDQNTGVLRLSVYGRESRDRKPRCFVTAERRWPRVAIREACDEVMAVVDPERKARVERYIEERAAAKRRERQDAKEKWSLFTPEELHAFAEKIGDDEYELYWERQNEEIDPSEYWPHARQYEEAFDIIEEILRERGASVEVVEQRPLAVRNREQLAALAKRDADFEEFMRSTPPLVGSHAAKPR